MQFYYFENKNINLKSQMGEETLLLKYEICCVETY